MNEKAWAYYSSAADDEITIRENHAAYHRYVYGSTNPTQSRLSSSHPVRIWFRPRILRNVTNVDWSTKILGIPSKMPIYIVSTIQVGLTYILERFIAPTDDRPLQHSASLDILMENST